MEEGRQIRKQIICGGDDEVTAAKLCRAQLSSTKLCRTPPGFNGIRRVLEIIILFKLFMPTNVMNNSENFKEQSSLI